MDPLLTVVALLVLGIAAAGFGIVRRLDQVHEQLKQLDQLGELAQRVDALSARVDRQEYSAALQAKLSEFTEEISRLSAAVAELRAAAGDPLAREPEAADLADRVRRHLTRMGFEQVHLLTDLAELEDDSGRVVFEARRRGVTHKGHLELEDGEVVNETVHSAYSTFP
jgi:chromosome segregation ATPase